MQITIWSDFICPFCYIGATHLEKALENFEHADEVEIEYKSYQLDPSAKYEPGKTYKEMMMNQKGMSEEQISQMISQIDTMATNAGLDYNFDTMKLTDTFPAHRVFQYAKEAGKGIEYFNKLYDAYFTNGELISDPEVIVRVIHGLGLDADQAKEILEDEKENDAKVVQDIYEASQVGVEGVPFFVFNNKYGISGAQPVETFEQVLTQVYEEFSGNSDA